MNLSSNPGRWGTLPAAIEVAEGGGQVMITKRSEFMSGETVAERDFFAENWMEGKEAYYSPEPGEDFFDEASVIASASEFGAAMDIYESTAAKLTAVGPAYLQVDLVDTFSRDPLLRFQSTASGGDFGGGNTCINDDDRTLLFTIAEEIDAEYGLEKAEYSCIDDPYGDVMAKRVWPAEES